MIVLVSHEMVAKGSSMVNSKRWPVRGARAQGDSACREMHGGLPQPCEGRQTAENTWAQANPLSAGARSPAARGVVNVRDQGHRRRDHDEAVKMVNFSRTKKPAKCDLNKNPREALVPGSWSPREETGCPLR